MSFHIFRYIPLKSNSFEKVLYLYLILGCLAKACKTLPGFINPILIRLQGLLGASFDIILDENILKFYIVFEEEIYVTPETPPKKGMFENLINMVSTRDEKDALEKALAELEEARKSAATANQAAQSATAAAQAGARRAAEEANKRTAAAEARIKQLEEQLRQMRTAEAQRAAKLKIMEGEERSAQILAPKIIAEHTFKSDESLSHLALKYYGHATQPYWMVIYEANKAAIGDNPNRVKVGTVLKIPELPAELKK